MRLLRCVSTGPCGAAQKPWGQKQAEESIEGAAAPHLQLREHLYSRRKVSKAGARPSATPAGRAAHTASAEELPASATACCPPEKGSSQSLP
ncbi:hypothetical protein NDU88_006693 [Pleurodeles waltl]|uniref:Uncharacterized protein n=1 Tax=Pleurodeles waltl TaxID=8319 RepID=A0AAV7X2E7_PLEWA|nr:hypothetical protein NDU88_006693 [Pleurodeles waltl]